MMQLNDFDLIYNVPENAYLPYIGDLEIRSYAPETAVFRQGDETNEMFFILNGSVKTLRNAHTGKLSYYRIRRAGEYFGYYALFSNKARSADAVTMEQTKCAVMSGEDFLSMVLNSPLMSHKLIVLITTILREETLRLSDIITLNADERVRNFLGKELKRQKTKDLFFSSREDMASHINLTRETLSRELNKLKRMGVVSLTKNFVTINRYDYFEDDF